MSFSQHLLCTVHSTHLFEQPQQRQSEKEPTTQYFFSIHHSHVQQPSHIYVISSQTPRGL